MLVLALGLTLNTKAGLGVSPIISIAFAVSEIWGWNFGDMTFLLYSLFVAGQFVLRGKNSRLTDLLQLPLSLAFSRVLNLYSALIPYEAAEHGFLANFGLLLAAIFFTGAGAAITVTMKLVPNPGDGIVAAVAERLGRDQGFAKNVFDVGCVAAHLCAGACWRRGRIVGIGVGTIAAMIGVGRSIALVNYLGKQKMCLAAGLLQEEAPAARRHKGGNIHEAKLCGLSGGRIHQGKALGQPRRGGAGRPGPHR